MNTKDDKVENSKHVKNMILKNVKQFPDAAKQAHVQFNSFNVIHAYC